MVQDSLVWLGSLLHMFASHASKVRATARVEVGSVLGLGLRLELRLRFRARVSGWVRMLGMPELTLGLRIGCTMP